MRLQVRFADERLAPADDNGVTVVLEHRGARRSACTAPRARRAGASSRACWNPLPVGGYHAWIAVPTLEGRAPAVDFSVCPAAGRVRPRADGRRPRCGRPPRRPRAASTPSPTAERLLDDLPEGRQVPIETLPPLPLWNKWPVLLVFLVLLIGEWILRKRGGMA